MTRRVDIVTEPEKCERGCGQDVAMTRRHDDGATRLSTIHDGRVLPGPHDGVHHDPMRDDSIAIGDIIANIPPDEFDDLISRGELESYVEDKLDEAREEGPRPTPRGWDVVEPHNDEAAAPENRESHAGQDRAWDSAEDGPHGHALSEHDDTAEAVRNARDAARDARDAEDRDAEECDGPPFTRDDTADRDDTAADTA
jgi:hypothetical protein